MVTYSLCIYKVSGHLICFYKKVILKICALEFNFKYKFNTFLKLSPMPTWKMRRNNAVFSLSDSKKSFENLVRYFWTKQKVMDIVHMQRVWSSASSSAWWVMNIVLTNIQPIPRSISVTEKGTISLLKYKLFRLLPTDYS